MATLKDVATLAGVSPITASRALNNPQLVHPDTIQKVRAAADQLTYVPSPVAQGLRSGHTRIITLVTGHKLNYDPLLFEFATGVSEACRKHGYSLLIHTTSDLKELHTLAGKVDGLILTDIRWHDERILDLKQVIPIAIFGQSQQEVPQIDVDNIRGAEIATKHLIAYGYQDIVLVTAESDLLFLQHREEGYRRAMAEANLEPVLTYAQYDAAGGFAAMGHVGRMPEAVVCTSDLMALGVLRWLREQRHLIPVVGYDGGYLTDVAVPTLTSVRQPFHTVGEQLTEALFDYMQDGNVRNELIEPELVEKSSTWPRTSPPPMYA